MEGGRADIVLVNENENCAIDASGFVSKGKNSPFDGTEVTGRVVHTIAGGRLAVEAEGLAREVALGVMMDRLLDAVVAAQNPSVLGWTRASSISPKGSPSVRPHDLDAGLKRSRILTRSSSTPSRHRPGREGAGRVLRDVRRGGDGGVLRHARLREAQGHGRDHDVKRNDIGSTATAYSAAYLGRTALSGAEAQAFPADFVTVNPYLGTDGIEPFVRDCATYKKGVFVLVKTSNPSGREIQDLDTGGCTLYERVGDLVAGWGAGLIGSRGYSSVGAVVGATCPEEGAALRKRLPTVCFLLPGYGAQGATAEGLAGCFDEEGLGAVVNASRSLQCAWKRMPGENDFAKATRHVAIAMKRDICTALNEAGQMEIGGYGWA